MVTKVEVFNYSHISIWVNHFGEREKDDKDGRERDLGASPKHACKKLSRDIDRGKNYIHTETRTPDVVFYSSTN